MPSRRTFGDWARRDPAFGQALAAAKAVARRGRLARDRTVDEGRGWRRMLSRAGQRGGSVSILTPELTEAICARIAGGESVLAIGADPAMPGAVSIHGWVRRDEAFREAYLAAKDVGADLLFDAAREIALECSEATVRSDRLRVQTLHRQVALLSPKKYGVAAERRVDRDEAEDQPFNVVIRNFCSDSPHEFTDRQGQPIPRPDWV